MKLEAEVVQLYLGEGAELEKTPCQTLQMTLEGIVGDKHGGFTRRADARNPEYKRGTLMRNDRQWSAVALEELEEVAVKMGLPRLDPAWLGANLALSGLPNLTGLPRGSKLFFPEGAVLVVENENLPCVLPGKVISRQFPDQKINSSAFPKAGMGKRGLVGVIERPGFVKVGDRVLAQLYAPRTFSLAAPAK